MDQLRNNTLRRTQQLGLDNHNTLGVLQSAAKALKAWLLFVATSLVYNVALIFSSIAGGLPTGDLMTHLKFTDLLTLIDPLLWTMPSPSARIIEMKRKLSRISSFGN